MDISVVIVSWNARRHLIECLSSLWPELTGLRSEVIVVDNASTDGSSAAVLEQFPDVKLIQNYENLGFARANNIGIARSYGRYILLVNSDVLLLEGCIRKMFSYMERNPDAGVLGPRILNPDHTLQLSCTRFPTLRGALLSAVGLETAFRSLRYFPHKGIEEVDVISGCFMMVRRRALDRVGPLDEAFFIYAEDKDWCKRFRDGGWKAVYFPHASAIHHGGASSKNMPVSFYIEMQKANLQYWEKHRGSTARAVYSGIILVHQSIRFLRGCLLYAARPSKRESSGHKIKRSGACIRWIFTGKGGLTPEGA